jgi:hypothetical protein
LKIGEDVQVGVESLSDVQIVLVTTAPTKRLAVCDSFDVVRVDAATVKNVLLGEVAAYDGNDTDSREEAGRDRKMRGRTAEHLLRFTKWGFDCVISNRSND